MQISKGCHFSAKLENASLLEHAGKKIKSANITSKN